MADDKSARDKQAQDADRRQRRRDVEAYLERWDDPEPPVDPDVLDAVESDLEQVSFPATAADVVAQVGDRPIETDADRYVVADLLPDAETERFESPAAVGRRVQRPTVAQAMKRIVEANDTLPNAEFRGSQREAFEKTFLALRAIDAGDDDEPIDTIADWVVEQIAETEKLPGSRAIRRQAATVCRANGYEVRNDEWLGV